MIELGMIEMGLLGMLILGGIIALISWTMAVEADSEKRHHRL